MIDRGMIDDAVTKERPVLHEPEHENPPGRYFLLDAATAKGLPGLPQSSRMPLR
jgi:hypothetical protein